MLVSYSYKVTVAWQCEIALIEFTGQQLNIQDQQPGAGFKISWGGMVNQFEGWHLPGYLKLRAMAHVCYSHYIAFVSSDFYHSKANTEHIIVVFQSILRQFFLSLYSSLAKSNFHINVWISQVVSKFV